MHQRLTAGVVGALALLCSMMAPTAEADFQVAVSINDPTGNYASYYGEITSGVKAAGADWSRHLANTSGILNLEVNFSDIPTANGGSTTSDFVGTDGPYYVFEQGALGKITRGLSPPGTAPDGIISIGTEYLTTLFFDPDPGSRTTPIPAGMIDAHSVFLHELGHILVFNAFRDAFNGTLPGDYESTFDALTVFDGSNFFFTGANAEALYGGPVPLTYGNIPHVGNAEPRPGSDLQLDLVNGVVFFYQQRYEISPLDLAMAEDTGVAIRSVPEPTSLTLAVIGGLALLLRACRRRARAGSPAFGNLSVLRPRP